MKITPPQMKRLQTVFGQQASRSLDLGNSREERLAWASNSIGRKIASFGDLTRLEAKLLIDLLQGTSTKTYATRRPQTRREGEKMGTEGRHDQIHAETTLVSPDDVNRVRYWLTRISWDQTRLDAFLASPRGPLGGRTTIRTLGDANRVCWALKRIAAQQEKDHASR